MIDTLEIIEQGTGKMIIELFVIKIEDKTVITNSNKYTGKSIILATGCENRKLGIENEIELIGKGVSYCATCDGNFYKDKKVCVVGGGNTAIEDALYLSNICEKVFLVHRRDTFKAEPKYLEELKTYDGKEPCDEKSARALAGG